MLFHLERLPRVGCEGLGSLSLSPFPSLLLSFLLSVSHHYQNPVPSSSGCGDVTVGHREIDFDVCVCVVQRHISCSVVVNLLTTSGSTDQYKMAACVCTVCVCGRG